MPMISRFGSESCEACRGKECFGGGNLKCAQRDPEPSIISAILGPHGRCYVVVTHADGLRQHVRPESTFAITSDVKVHEPIAWGDIPGLCHHIDWVVDEWINNNLPNESYKQEAIAMYRLRRLEQNPRSLDLHSIVET